MSSEITHDEDLSDTDVLRPILWQLAETVSRRMKKSRIAGGGVMLVIFVRFVIVRSLPCLSVATGAARALSSGNTQDTPGNAAGFEVWTG